MSEQCYCQYEFLMECDGKKQNDDIDIPTKFFNVPYIDGCDGKIAMKSARSFLENRWEKEKGFKNCKITNLVPRNLSGYGKIKSSIGETIDKDFLPTTLNGSVCDLGSQVVERKKGKPRSKLGATIKIAP